MGWIKIVVGHAVLLALAALFWFGAGAQAFSVVLLALLIGGWLVFATVGALGGQGDDAIRLSAIAQGVAACVTIVAVLSAAGIYFVERRDRTRFVFTVEAKAIGVDADDGSEAVLLAIRVPIENRGQRRLEFPCMALEVNVLPREKGLAVERTPGFPEELHFARLPGTIDYADTAGCRAAEEKFRNWAPGSIRPYFMWAPHSFEPDEVDDLYFETVVPCRYSLARVLVKMRSTVAYRNNVETKVLVPLSGVCSGKTVTSAATADARATEAQGPKGQAESLADRVTRPSTDAPD